MISSNKLIKPLNSCSRATEKPALMETGCSKDTKPWNPDPLFQEGSLLAGSNCSKTRSLVIHLTAFIYCSLSLKMPFTKQECAPDPKIKAPFIPPALTWCLLPVYSCLWNRQPKCWPLSQCSPEGGDRDSPGWMGASGTSQHPWGSQNSNTPSVHWSPRNQCTALP